MALIFGFCGRKRSGKGVLSNIVKETYNGKILSAANYLKNICCEILKIDLNRLNTIKDDGTTFSIYPDNDWYGIINGATGIDKDIIKETIGNIEFTNVRQMLQVIGTDLIRKYYPQWHVDCLVKDIKQCISEDITVAVDDVRFPNEKKAIEDLGGTCYFIVRNNMKDISNHESETSLTWDMFDYDKIIINYSSLEGLKCKFRIFLSEKHRLKDFISLFFSDRMDLYGSTNLFFGKEYNEVVEDILKQNKDCEEFRDNGLIMWKPSTEEIKDKFLEQIQDKKYYNDNKVISLFFIYNPIINENLKRYL